jgi:hypothetical protein
MFQTNGNSHQETTLKMKKLAAEGAEHEGLTKSELL